MTTEQLQNRASNRPSRAWLWLLVLPVAGFATFAALVVTILVMTKNIEKSPGYALASTTVSNHLGVEDLLGAPVRVTGTKSKHISKTPTATTLELTFALSGASADGTASVTAREKAGVWVVERATVASPRGQFGLLPDGGLQSLYDPKGGLARGY